MGLSPRTKAPRHNSVGRSSNGRTKRFDRLNVGSTPALPATTSKGNDLSYPPCAQDKKVVREYVIARLDKNDNLATRIWNANPDLQDAMIVAMLTEKGDKSGCV